MTFPTITQERTRFNNVRGHPTMRTRPQWGAARSYTDSNPVSSGAATRIFVHISITNPSSYNGFDAHAQAIEHIGILRFPNTGISYNRLFMAGSTVAREGQPMGRRGAHTVNDFRRSTCSTSGCPGRGGPLTAPGWNLNYNARSYVWAANVQHSVPAATVDLMARTIVTDYRAGFITEAAARNPHGHRCVSAKSCPADKMWALMDDLERKIAFYITNGLGDEDEMQEADWNRFQKIAEAAAEKAVNNATIEITTFKGNKVKRSLKAAVSYIHAIAIRLEHDALDPVPNRTLVDPETGGHVMTSRRNLDSWDHFHSKNAAENTDEPEEEDQPPVVPLNEEEE